MHNWLELASLSFLKLVEIDSERKSHNRRPADGVLAMQTKWILSAIAGAVVVTVLVYAMSSNKEKSPQSESRAPPVVIDVTEPRFLNAPARLGRQLYLKKCLSCHGKSGRGSRNGPPLVLYRDYHHDDEKFAIAIRSGVKQHHWNFGDMPPIESVTEQEIVNVTAYIRAIQAHQDAQENGPFR